MNRATTAARSDAYEVIRRDAIAGIERRRLQPERQLSEVQVEVERAVEAFQHRARLGEQVPLGDETAMTRRVLRSITDLGPLTELLSRLDVEEVFVEGARVTYLDTAGRLRGLAEPTTEDENRQILDRMLAETERQLNAKHPMVQARILDGTARLTAAIPPIGCSLVMREPIVFTMRQPPVSVPRPMAVWAASTTQIGTSEPTGR